MPAYPIGREAHHDVPLSNYAVSAFARGPEQGYIAQEIFPAVTVANESDEYYIIDPESWMREYDSARSRNSRAARVEWKVSSDTYNCKNHALANEMALEDLANADMILSLREESTAFVVDKLLQGLERRTISKVTSISNVGSGVALVGTFKWSDPDANILAQVNSGMAFVRNKTGLIPNTLAVDWDTFQLMKRNKSMSDFFKIQQGLLTLEQMQSFLMLDRILVSRAVSNTAAEGVAASIGTMWGNNALLYYKGMTGRRTATFGTGFRWRPEGLPVDFQVIRSRYDRAGEAHSEVIEAGYFGDEKIVGKDLAYLFTGTL